MNTLTISCCVLAMGVLVGSTGSLEHLTTKLFSNCAEIESWLGIQYRQLNNTSSRPDVSLVNLYHYTRASTTSRSLVGAAKKLLRDSNFNKKIPVTIYCHGWLQAPGDPSIITVTDTLKAKGGQNILHLDAIALIGSLYLHSAATLQFIGEALAVELNILVQNGIPRQNIHIIGFSMGAHIAGFAGKEFIVLNGGLLGHITGLDPAGLCFYHVDDSLRLNSGDAAFVDIIHTNSGVWGTITPHGHVDFYPNNGHYQPGCLIPICSHSRAWQVYSESILNNRAFPAVKCGNWTSYIHGYCKFNSKAFMGYAIDKTTRGVYNLNTNAFYPYGLKKNSSNSTKHQPFVRRRSNKRMQI